MRNSALFLGDRVRLFRLLSMTLRPKARARGRRIESEHGFTADRHWSPVAGVAILPQTRCELRWRVETEKGELGVRVANLTSAARQL